MSWCQICVRPSATTILTCLWLENCPFVLHCSIPNSYQPFYAIMRVASILVPDRCQAINNHHADITVTMQSHESCHIMFQCLYSLSGKTSYHKILRCLEALRLDVMMIVLLWNLTGISAVLLPWCLLNFNMNLGASRLHRSCDETSVCLVNRGPGARLTKT